MNFFEQYNVPKSSKIAITHLLSNITTKPDSHKGGWTRLLKCQLNHCGYSEVKIIDNKDSILNYDVVIFDLGAEYSGALNMFGGLDGKVFTRLKELEQFQGSIFSWRNTLPELTTLETRRSNSSTCEEFKGTDEGFLSRNSQKLQVSNTFDHVYKTSGLILSDSHGPSIWTPDLMIERRDGRTLKGLLDNHTIPKYLNTFRDEAQLELETLQVHCSSIDIRHHVFRETNPEEYIAWQAQRLLDQMQVFQGHKIFTHTMGIEDESRELPKTGYFKGTPFYGTWDQRNLARTIFNSVIELGAQELGADICRLPDYFFDEVGKLKFDVMERPQSVHTSPAHYKTDLDTGKIRW